jgi:hypothetical protein
LSSIPDGLFNYCPLVTNFSSAFYQCYALTGNAPELWISYPNASGEACFYENYELYNYVNIPNLWKGVYDNVNITVTVGETGADYSTLKLVFDDINSGILTGKIIIQIIDNTTETATATLNATGSGSASYTSILIYPTITGKIISGEIAAPLINLNGTSNVIIDGRVNRTGSVKDLTIKNTSISAISGTSCIRFINYVNWNYILYCNLQGSGINPTNTGIVLFSTSTEFSGNIYNTISNNNITSSSAGRTVNAIYSLGSAGSGSNSYNTIRNNNIYDFLKHGTASCGINIAGNSSDFNIISNSFYETTSFISTAAATYNIININNSAGTGFEILYNNIGGQESLCGGSALTKTNATNNVFNGIYVNASSGNNIKNNIIKNINWGNSSNAAWTGIYFHTSSAGIIKGNTIGNTLTDSISVTGGITGTIVYGININSANNVECKNNYIGSITANNVSTGASNIYCINKTAVAGVTTINNNIIGSLSTPNSISSTSVSSANTQSVVGIRNLGTGNITINHNIVANLNNGTTNVNGYTGGLYFGDGNEYSVIDSNFIYNLSSGANSLIYGVFKIAGSPVFYNNIISLGNSTINTIYGFYETGSSGLIIFYNNTIYIKGTPVSGALNSYALFSNSDIAYQDYGGNILYNARSNNGATGKHYSVQLSNIVSNIDENDYYVSGTGGVLGYLGGDITTLANWKIATTFDANSLNTNPTFVNAGGILAEDYKIGIVLNTILGGGGIVIYDYGDNVRVLFTMGAWE